MAYTTINKSTDYFNTKLYTGNGSTQSITGVGFQPDFTWVKGTSVAEHHNLYDAVRGVTKPIYTNLTYGEGSASDSLTAFNSDGFSIGANAYINTNSATFASWNWKAGGGQGSSNTDGTINSTVSANTTAGFSIVKYTGNGTAGATIGHGLGVVPTCMIVKSVSATEHWQMYHHKLGATKYIELSSTAAEVTSSDRWNNTAPTSSVFSVGGHTSVNTNGTTYIAYCFAEKTGYSKFGKYTGNFNADGTFIYTGFKPEFVIVKKIAASGPWRMFDSTRAGNVNPANKWADANTNSGGVSATDVQADLVSNGIKLRDAANAFNTSGSEYIYFTFASESLVGTNDIPATAR